MASLDAAIGRRADASASVNALGVRDEGQLASGDPAPHVRRGTDARVRVAGRVGTCVRLGAGARPGTTCCSRPISRRARSMSLDSRAGVRVTLDNLYPLKMWPEVFRGREIFVRIDPGFGRGHHQHVRTAGVHSKFGVPLGEADELVAVDAGRRRSRHGPACAYRQRHFRCRELDRDRRAARRIWPRVSRDVQIVDLGGGIGVPEQSRPRRDRSARARARCVAI